MVHSASNSPEEPKFPRNLFLAVNIVVAFVMLGFFIGMAQAAESDRTFISLIGSAFTSSFLCALAVGFCVYGDNHRIRFYCV